MRPLIITGPTGIGKTALAVGLAKKHPFGLISADSMQIYRGMPIGTAQPSAEELEGLEISCCGHVDPSETFNVKQFLDQSARAHERIDGEGKHPLYVGGTGMYLRSLRWGLAEEASGTEQGKGTPLRDRLESELREKGSEAMHRQLQEVDPKLAERVSPTDAIRIVRGLENFEITGQPLSDLHTHWEQQDPRFPHSLVILHCPREELVRRIEKRTDQMLETGWIDEVESLLNAGVSPKAHCFKALGYRQIAAYLAGDLDKVEMSEQIKAKTRQFAKRQMTWFRRERGAKWIDVGATNREEIIVEIEKLLESEGVQT